MPRNVRNFWVSTEVDGRASRVAAGPKSADGGFYQEILIREDGEISDKRLEVIGEADSDGTLRLKVIFTEPGGRGEWFETIEVKR